MREYVSEKIKYRMDAAFQAMPPNLYLQLTMVYENPQTEMVEINHHKN